MGCHAGDVRNQRALSCLITATDDLGRSSTNSFSFDTFDPASVIVIEAEDYNYGNGVCDAGASNPPSTTGGLYQINPPASGYDTNGVQVGGLQTNGSRLGYVGAAGLPGVDFNDTSETPVGDPAYRPCDPVVTRNNNTYFADTAPDLRRARFVAAGVRDFVAADWQAGDWLNYTRVFHGRYRSYLRAATTSDGRTMVLDRVTSDPTNPINWSQPLASSRSRAPDSCSACAQFRSWTRTVRRSRFNWRACRPCAFTAPDTANNISVNYFVFVPDTPRQPTRPVLGNPIVSGGSFSFSFQTESGFTYALEYRELLGAGAWQRLAPTVAGDGAMKSFNRPTSASTGFFRLAVE